MAVEYPIQPATRGLGAGANGFVKGASLGVRRNITVYVDALNGSDDNDGLTQATALQTVEAAHRRVPTCSVGPSSNVIVYLAGVGGFGANATAQQTYAVESMLLPSSGHAEIQRFHYRGPQMVRAPDLTTGPNNGTISALTSLWWPPSGSARSRTVSASSPGDNYVCGGVKVSRSGGAAWTPSDGQAGPARFVRFTRGGRKVLFECPIAQLGTDYFILDLAPIPDGTKAATALQVGDTWEIVECGAKLFNPNSTRINIEGQGGGQGVPGDYTGSPASRGGGGFWCERIEFGSSFMAGECQGLSFDRCDFDANIGDENYIGGSGVFVNCLHTSLGVILHGYWHSLHDSANCRPDVASDDSTADPIYQDVDAFSMWGVCRGGCRVFVGSGTSQTPASLIVERNLSVYDAQAQAALFCGYGARFGMLDQRNRSVQIQGTGNILGIDVADASVARYTLLGGLNGPCPMAHLLGDNGVDALDDCRLGIGTTHTWDEVYGGGTLPAPSGPNNWLYPDFNFSRLTAYDA